MRLPPDTKIVLRGTNWVGDTVMSVPAMRELRRAFPLCPMAYWGPSGLAGLALSTGVFDSAVTFQGRTGRVRRPLVMAVRLRSEGLGMAVLFQNAFESALTAFLARIPLRAGYPTDLRGPLLNVRVPMAPDVRQRHEVYYYLGIVSGLVRMLGLEPAETCEPPDCSVDIPVKNIDDALRILAEAGVQPDKPFWCLCPGSVNSEAKRWPAESFAVLADLIYDRLAARVVFLGSPQERDLIDGIIRRMGRPSAVNLAGRADMLTSMAVMKSAQIVISNDTGSAHLAVAASGTVLTIFGPTVAGATAPFGPNAHIIEGTARCAPCRNFRCPLPDHPCMRSVAPDAVLEAALKAQGRHSSW